MKLVPGGDNLVKDVQCYELFGGIALKIHAFSFSTFDAALLSVYFKILVNCVIFLADNVAVSLLLLVWFLKSYLIFK